MKTVKYMHPILNCAESQKLEVDLFNGDEKLEWLAMNRAGLSIAEEMVLDFRETFGVEKPKTFLVLVGKGHNGGDAVIALRHLMNRSVGSKAFIVFPYGLSKLRPLTQRALDELQVAQGECLKYLSVRSGAEEQLNKFLDGEQIDVCIDGILGMQFRPPVRGLGRELIEAVNKLRIGFRAAIDLPSGMGDESDELSFEAEFTYATGILKAPLVEQHGTAGRIRYLDLGFFDEADALFGKAVITKEILSFRNELREPHTHKKKMGHVFVVGGSAKMPGAILMTVEAALRSGVGLVTAFVPESIAAEAAVIAPEAMWVPMPEIPDDGGLALEGLGFVREKLSAATGFVLGPGMGTNPETHTLVQEIIKLSNVPLLLDADALRPELIDKIQEGRSVCLTPHVGEFGRLIGEPGIQCVGNEKLKNYAKEKGVVVSLKGSPTRITEGERVCYSLFGGPVLARGGSGDVLSGLVGGRISIPDTKFLEEVCQAVAWHGNAADELARNQGQVTAKATDLLEWL